jgi:integrase
MPAAFSKALKRHLEQLGISGQSAQRLRHAFNSLGALTGSDELTRSKLMGHTGVQMTRGRYTTIYSEAARKTIAMLEGSLNIGTKLGPNEPERFIP